MGRSDCQADDIWKMEMSSMVASCKQVNLKHAIQKDSLLELPESLCVSASCISDTSGGAGQQNIQEIQLQELQK